MHVGRRAWSKGRIFVAACLATLVACAVFFLLLATVDIRTYAEGRYGRLAERIERDDGQDSLFRRTLLTLKSSEGLVAEGAMLTPVDATTPLPVFIVLGGKQTGKEAVNYVTDLDDAIVLALDYPYEPRRSYSIGDVIEDLPKVRRAMLDMVPAVKLVVDHLSQMALVDTNRIVLVGYSFGAPFVPSMMAVDPRIDVAVMAYGGANVSSLVHHNVRRTEGAAFSAAIGAAAWVLLRPIEPLRFAEDISPRYALMINGTEDERIPRENVDALWTALGEPKERVWIESAHVHPTNVELTRTIIREMKQALMRKGILSGE